MSVKFYWFAPTGDGEHIGLKKPEREPTLDYIIKIAQTAEHMGFEGMLIPVGTPFLDSWLVGSAIVHHTTKLKPLTAFRPGFIPPSVSAKMAATLDQFSEGRFLINVVTGGCPFWGKCTSLISTVHNRACHCLMGLVNKRSVYSLNQVFQYY